MLNKKTFHIGQVILILCSASLTHGPASAETSAAEEYPVSAGSHPHDVAPAPDGRV